MLTHKLLYLSQGEISFSEVDLSSTQSADVEQELLAKLLHLPLSENFRDKVLEVSKNEDNFWVKISKGELPEARNISELAVKLGITDCSSEHQILDIFILMKFINEETYLAAVLELSKDLAGKVFVPHLADFLDEVSVKNCPSLLFYDEICPHSQAVLYSLHQELQAIVKVCWIYIYLFMTCEITHDISCCTAQARYPSSYSNRTSSTSTNYSSEDI